MLLRILILGVCGLIGFAARAETLDRQLIGKWKDELGVEIIFRPNHTTAKRSDPYI